MKKVLQLFLISTLLMIGCENQKPANSNDDKLLIEYLIKANFKAVQNEDLQAYLDTVDPESEAASEKSKQMIQALFINYDLNYTLEKVDIVSIEGNKAKVNITATVKKNSGPAFVNNRTVSENFLVKTGEGWKINSTKLIKFEKLE